MGLTQMLTPAISRGSKGIQMTRQIQSVGIYRIVREDSKILLVQQPKPRGVFPGKYDFPGGGVEFGETLEEALRREFLKELNATFQIMEADKNLTAVTDVAADQMKEPFGFYQIGLLYHIQGLQFLDSPPSHKILDYSWVTFTHLTKDNSSALLWQYKHLLE